MSVPPIVYPAATAAAVALQRRAEARLQPDWAQAALSDPTTRFLVSRGTTHLIRREPQPQIAFVGPDHELLAAVEPSQLVLLGWFHDERCVLVELAPDSDVSVSGATFEELRALVALLPEDQA